jgi:hypothetical protein
LSLHGSGRNMDVSACADANAERTDDAVRAIFRYTLTLNETEYQERWVKPYAEGIAQTPGLISKTWMADFESGTFASFYLWQDKASMEAFMASPAIAQVAAEPFLKDLNITAIPVQEGATLITGG